LVGCLEINIVPNNSIMIDNEEYPLLNGYYDSYGLTDSMPGNNRTPNPSHYNEIFILTNGYLSNGEFNESITDLLFADLYAKGDIIVNGTYQMEGELITNNDGKAISRLVFKDFTRSQDGAFLCKEVTLKLSSNGQKRVFRFDAIVERTVMIDEIQQITSTHTLTGQFSDTLTEIEFSLN
jgi:hypothetical protein